MDSCSIEVIRLASSMVQRVRCECGGVLHLFTYLLRRELLVSHLRNRLLQDSETSFVNEM